jgi:DNA (cytosine-5)-methyltransferase 1
MDVIDLFCGAGGMSAGFTEAGCRVTAAFDTWKPALAVYRDNLGPHAEELDLSSVAAAVARIDRLVPQPHLIAGSPPCQDFSPAGGRAEGPRARLTVAFAEIVVAIRPRWFVMENVPRVWNSNAYRAARELLSGHYGLTEVVLDASLCGVPQRRKRFFCIGCLGESDGFLDAAIRRRLASKPLTVHKYMGSELGKLEHFYRHPRSRGRRGIIPVCEPAPTVRGTNRPMPPGYVRRPGDSSSPGDGRALTYPERSRLQTFLPGWRWTGSITAIETMIGNAVPVQLARFVAEAILAFEAAQRTVAVLPVAAE